MRFWIDIENSSGARQGDGPITSALEWESVARLDRAGTFRFTVSGSESRLSLATVKRVARCRAIVGGAVVDLGAGIIDNKSLRWDNSGNATLEISGGDLLRELTYRIVGDLAIYVESTATPRVLYYDDLPSQTFTELTSATDGNPATFDTVTIDETGDRLFVGHSTTFNIMRFVLGAQVNAVSADWGVAYSDGAGGYLDLDDDFDFTDGTEVSGAPFGQNGDVQFVGPAAWLKQTENGIADYYWVRYDPNATIGPIDFAEISVIRRVATTNDLSAIMALAPAGWSLDTADWYGSTTNGSYVVFAGETVLNALVKIAEKYGEHFRLGDGRQVEWLRTDPQDGAIPSGITAIWHADAVALEDNADACLILDIEEVEDSYDLVTRVYPYGAGNSNTQFTLLDASVSMPAGYTMSTADNYIESDAGVTAYGRIERRMLFKDIVTSDGTAATDTSASDTLATAALNWLKRHDTPYKSYRLTVTGLKGQVKPGETINVICRKVVELEDGTKYEAVNINTYETGEPLIVLEATTRVDASGIHTVALQVATSDRWPETDADLLVSQLEQATFYITHAQPVSEKLTRD